MHDQSATVPSNGSTVMEDAPVAREKNPASILGRDENVPRIDRLQPPR
jgi:hypothetical protein